MTWESSHPAGRGSSEARSLPLLCTALSGGAGLVLSGQGGVRSEEEEEEEEEGVPGASF